jgi:hypothetical protein
MKPIHVKIDDWYVCRLYVSKYLGANVLRFPKYLDTINRQTYLYYLKDYKMPKRFREDDASEALIQQMLQEDIQTTPESLASEKMAIEMTYEDAIEGISREFGNPDNLDARKALIYKQKKEYEEGLKNDRLIQLQGRADKHQQATEEAAEAKEMAEASAKRRRVITEDIATVKELVDETCYRKLGKIRHLQKTLLNKKETFTPDQREQYDLVIEELKKKGHRVLK